MIFALSNSDCISHAAGLLGFLIALLEILLQSFIGVHAVEVGLTLARVVAERNAW